MISKDELDNLAKARLKDASILFDANRYDGSVYLCGYVVELSLKLRICKILKWDGFPSTRSEFQDFRSFRTHNFDVLLALTGMEDEIKTNYLAEWSAITIWDPEVRYNPIGSVDKTDAELMIDSAEKLMDVL